MTTLTAQRETTFASRRRREDAVLEAVLGLVGTPYIEPLTGRADGFDCATFVAHVYELLGWRPPFRIGPDGRGLPQLDWEDFAGQFEDCDPEPWCLVWFRGERHVGVLLPGDRVAHCREGHGVILQPLARIRRLVAGFVRLRGGARWT